MTSEWVNHTGGCEGADIYWETEGRKYGVFSISYSFPKHTQYGENQLVLTIDELLEGWKNIQKASETMKRPLSKIEFNPYIRNLLCRNWFQVKGANSIFAIGTIVKTNHSLVNGGTGWAVQMAIDEYKDVYLFEQEMDCWMKYVYEQSKFVQIDYIPTLTNHFAGIGSRDLKDSGKRAIEEIYKHTFKLNNNGKGII
jgi:hypothetical protein